MWNLLKELDALAVKTGEKLAHRLRHAAHVAGPQGAPAVGHAPAEGGRAGRDVLVGGVASFGVGREGALAAARTTYRRRGWRSARPLREGIAYLAAMAAVNGATDGGVDDDDDDVVVVDEEEE